ncbi:MAG: hypothetical protein RL264_1857 [Bacteroidota bacterium]|jgi:hypothetical protein
MRNLLFVFLFTFGVSTLIAQPTKSLTNQDSYNIMFGASWSFIDDDGQALQPFNVSQYIGSYYPTRFFFDKYIYNGWSAEMAFSFNKYNPQKFVNDSIGVEGSMVAIDLQMKYSFYKLLGSGFFDPYIGMGLGLTTRTPSPLNTAKSLSPTLNLTVGSNFWLGNNFGVQFQAAGKFGTTDFFKTSNYLQYTAGIVIRLDKSDGSKSNFHKSKYKIKKNHTKIKIKKSKGQKET